MCEQKRAPRPLASSPLAHVNYLRPPQSWRQLALFHSFVCSFICFVYPTLRQTTGHLFRLLGGPGGPLQKSISVLLSARVCVWLSHASGKHAPCGQTLGLRHCFQLYSDEKQIQIYFNRRELKRYYTLAITLHFDFQRIDTADRLAALRVQRCYSAYVGFHRSPVRSYPTSDTFLKLTQQVVLGTSTVPASVH